MLWVPANSHGMRPATTLIESLTLLVVILQDLLQRYQGIAFQPQPVPPLFLELHERPFRGNKKPAFWMCLAGAFRPKKLPYPPLDAAEALDITGMNLQKGVVPSAGDKRTKGARTVKVSDPAICLSGLLSAARGCQAGGRRSSAVGTVAHLNTWLATACWPASAAAFREAQLSTTALMCAGCSWLINGQQEVCGAKREGNTAH